MRAAATSKMLTLGFRELGLARHPYLDRRAQPVGPRRASACNFKPIGRQRQCHYIDGRAYDRLWFDLLASEHEEIDDVRHQRTA